MRNIVRSSYTRSRCFHLNSTIDLDSVLDILGEQALTLQSNNADDLLDIELLEEVAWHISQHYIQHLAFMRKKNQDVKNNQTQNNKFKNHVICFVNKKIRRANIYPQ